MTTEVPRRKGYGVGMALGGPPDDQGYFQSFADGLALAEEELGVVGSVQGNLDTEEKRVDGVRNLAADNAIVIAAGAEMSDAMLTVAAEYPDVKFLSITGEMDPELPNLAAYYVRQGAPNAVGAAVLAELQSPSKIGVIGGLDIPPTTQVEQATQTVADKLSPPAEVTTTIIASFEDTEGAKQAATGMVNEGSTAIVAFVNTGIDGVIAALARHGHRGHREGHRPDLPPVRQVGRDRRYRDPQLRRAGRGDDRRGELG